MKLQVAALGAALLAVGWLRAFAAGAASPTTGRPVVASLPPTAATSAATGRSVLTSKSTSIAAATTRSSVAAGSSVLTSKSTSIAAATTRSSVAAGLPATGGTVSQVNYRNASTGSAYTSARSATNATQPTAARQTQPVPANGSSYATARRGNGTVKVGSPSVAASTLPTTKANRSASGSGDGIQSSGAAASSRQATTSKAAPAATTTAAVARPLASEKSSVAAGSTSPTAFKSGPTIAASTSTAKTAATTTARLKMSLVALPVNSSSSGDVGSPAVKSHIPPKAFAGMMFAITCSVSGQPVTNVSVVSSTGEKILECTASAEGKAYGTFVKYLDSNLSSPSCAAALNASAANGSAAVTFYFTAADATLPDGYYRCSATYWNGSSIVSAIDDQVWPFVTYIPPTSLFIAPSPLTFVDGSLATVNCSTYAKPPADLLITVDCRECDFVSVTKVPQEINAFMPAGYSYATARLVAAAKWNGVKITCNVTNHKIFTNSITSSLAIQSSTSIPLSSTEIVAAAVVQTTSAATNEKTPWENRFFWTMASVLYTMFSIRILHL